MVLSRFKNVEKRYILSKISSTKNNLRKEYTHELFYYIFNEKPIF